MTGVWRLSCPPQEKLGEPVAADSEEVFTVFSTFLRQFLMVRKDLYPDWDPAK